MNVLGISALFHDSAACLAVDGRVVAAAQEERFSRAKNDARLPLEAIDFCLEQAGLASTGQLDQVVFYEKPLRKFDRLISTSVRRYPRGLRRFTRAMATWLGDRLWLHGRLARTLGVAPNRVLFADHHLSHAASAFFPSPYDDAAVLTVDGVGEWAATAIHRGVTRDGRASLETLAVQRFPHSMGLLYSALTAYLGFRVNSGECKVMGLASYGEPRFVDAFERFCRVDDDGTLTLDLRYFCFDWHAERSFTPRLEALLGPARAPEAPIRLDGSDPESRRWADVAATLQLVCERFMLAAARRAKALTGAADLCLAGGVALNSVANGRVAREAGFERVYVHPAAGDAGGALGAALLGGALAGAPRDRRPLTCALGRGWSREEVLTYLRDCRIRHRVFDSDAELNRDVAGRLARGEVLAWVDGRFEWGPRALGRRSILADPRDPGMSDRLNACVKLREDFRPFAPAVRAEEAARWFELSSAEADLAPHMLTVARLTDAGRAALPAVCHVDGTARVQTVSVAEHPRLHALLTAFAAETGVGVLLNTSLNLRGEPINASPADALSTLSRSGLDGVVLEGCLVERAA